MVKGITMTNVIQNMRPEDLTMSLASNHIEREDKIFTNASDRIFVPDGGPFFSQSLIIKDNNGNLLRPQIDYQLLYLNEGATLESGRDVVSVINVLKDTIPSVTLDYRVVGGSYGNTVNAILQAINNSTPISKNVDWNTSVYSKPTEFPPAPHYHTPDTFTGWSTIYVQLDNMRKAILVGDDPSWESHYNYIDNVINTLDSNVRNDLETYATKSYVNSMLTGNAINIDLSDYYTRSQTNNLLTTTEGKLTTLSDSIYQNVYTKVQSDSKYALINDSYTKAQSDSKYALINDYHTKNYSDINFATKSELIQLEQRLSGVDLSVDLSNYYTKSATNQAISDALPNMNLYYPKSETYTKQEVINQISQEVDNIPDVDFSNYYSKFQVEQMIAAALTEAAAAGSSGTVVAYAIYNISATVTVTQQGGWTFNGFTPNRFNYQGSRNSTVDLTITLPTEFDPTLHRVEIGNNPYYPVTNRTVTVTSGYTRYDYMTGGGGDNDPYPAVKYILNNTISVKIIKI